MSRTAEALTRAADVLEAEGWIQGRTHGPLGHCAVGALALVTGQDRRVDNRWVLDVTSPVVFHDAVRALEDIITIPGDPPACVPAWNDDPLRTGDEVVKTMRAAAETLGPL